MKNRKKKYPIRWRRFSLLCRLVVINAFARTLVMAGIHPRGKSRALIPFLARRDFPLQRVMSLFLLVAATLIMVGSWSGYDQWSASSKRPVISGAVSGIGLSRQSAAQFNPLQPVYQNTEDEIWANSSQELIQQLKLLNLWDVSGFEEIPAVLVRSFPSDLGQVGVEAKKRAFIHSMLPTVMVALEEVRQERQSLMAVLNELGKDSKRVTFSNDNSGWQETLAQEQVQFVLSLTKKYRVQNGAELLRRVNVLPASLVIAQSAMESSWGASRFASEANNLFGMWTWGGKGIVPSRRDETKPQNKVFP